MGHMGIRVGLRGVPTGHYVEDNVRHTESNGASNGQGIGKGNGTIAFHRVQDSGLGFGVSVFRVLGFCV